MSARDFRRFGRFGSFWGAMTMECEPLQAIVNGKRIFECPVKGCKKSSGRKYNIQAHMRMHTEEMPYVCMHSGCKMSFKWRSSLVNHERYHDTTQIGRSIISPRAFGRRKSVSTIDGTLTPLGTPRNTAMGKLIGMASQPVSPDRENFVYPMEHHTVMCSPCSPRSPSGEDQLVSALSDPSRHITQAMNTCSVRSMLSPRSSQQNSFGGNDIDANMEESFYCEVKILDKQSETISNLFKCNEPECGKLFSYQEHLDVHIAEHNAANHLLTFASVP
eukprot:Plantae.Rhodophyta-Purpureofilum_apyrenoidigerum.ctg15246.p1 GENE.Plantae.Rhodophyta-Purpureofilum_apyrenoidigerum.ctg15246~~Plantae.Rhodophyta-Purpureofilum_apyrenoidigerum.ctg15246.p1  ORF type:complete len:275 (-),score=28.97 Plantae.Rhodophyta-Purpureofilum_apyrenoidigerum.ctg15246:108-932(-)